MTTLRDFDEHDARGLSAFATNIGFTDPNAEANVSQALILFGIIPKPNPKLDDLHGYYYHFAKDDLSESKIRLLNYICSLSEPINLYKNPNQKALVEILKIRSESALDTFQQPSVSNSAIKEKVKPHGKPKRQQ